MSAKQHYIQYGDSTIEYTLEYAARKTLEISVHPDLRVTVKAPHETAFEAIEAKVQKRAHWILRQQREFELYLPHMPEREYISGETHRYLGRQYRLKVIQGEKEWIKLDRGYLYVQLEDKTDTARVEQLVDRWYLRQAQRVFKERLDEILPRFNRLNLPEFELKIKKLQAKWGSCTDSAVITLNIKLMQVAKPYIDYVIVHELCHLLEHNHSKRFYLLLDQVMPDWQTRRKELNEQEFV